MGALALPGAVAGIALGVLLADAGMAPDGPLLAGVGVALLGSSAVVTRGSRPRPLLLVSGVLAIGLALGAWRGAASAMPAGADSVTAHIGPTAWRLAGSVVEDPRPRGERQQAILDELVLAADGQPPHAVRGRVLVWLPRSSLLRAGDRLDLEARLEAARDFEGFAYGAYLARQGIGAVASAYGARVVEHRLGAIPDSMGSLRRWLLTGLNAHVPEPEAALGGGILLGARAGIAPEVNEAFARAGLTHVVAISGWNIAIVAAMASAASRPLTRFAWRTARCRPGGRLGRRRLRPSDRRLAIGRASGADGGRARPRAPRRITGACPLWIAAGRVADAVRRATGPLGRRVSALRAGDGGTHLVRGAAGGMAPSLAGPCPRAGGTHPGCAADDAARDPAEFRAALARGALRQRGGRAPRALGDALLGGCGGGRWSRRRAACAARRRPGGLDKRWRRLALPATHDSGRAGCGVAAIRSRRACHSAVACRHLVPGPPVGTQPDRRGHRHVEWRGHAAGRTRIVCRRCRAADPDGVRHNPRARAAHRHDPPGRPAGAGDARRGTGRRDPHPGTVGRHGPDRRWRGSRSDHAPPGRGAALLAAPPRRGGAHPPARGPRCRTGGGARALLRQAHPRFGRCVSQSHLPALPRRRAAGAGSEAGRRARRRPRAAGWGHDAHLPLPVGSGRGGGAARRRHQQRLRRRHVGERRLSRAAHRGRRGAGRDAAPRARPAGADRRPEGRPSRLGLEHDRRAAGDHPPAACAHLARGRQRIRPPSPRHARAPGGRPRAGGPPHRPGGHRPGRRQGVAVHGSEPARAGSG